MLARAINSLSHELSNLGCKEEALRAVEEAMELYGTVMLRDAAEFDAECTSLHRSVPNFSMI